MTRRAARSEIAGRAMELFVEHGFDRTTVDEIAEAVGLSARSVFRYFSTKEEIALGNTLDIGLALAATLDARPPDEPPWQAIRRSLDEPLRALQTDGAALARATILTETRSLRAARLERLARWADLLVPTMTRRLGAPDETRTMRAHAIVSSAMSCLDSAVGEWTRLRGARPLDDLLDTAIAAVLS